MTLLSELLNSSPVRSDGGDYVEERIPVPFRREGEAWRYTVEGETICVSRKGSPEVLRGSLRGFLWDRLALDQVCARYWDDYQAWVADNNGVPYLATEIEGDDGARWEQSYDFMDRFLGDCKSGLHLLMAEYGMGKTSFCYGLRKRVSEQVGSDEPAIKEPFLSGEASFPFVFNLNEYRDQDFDRFIQSKLFDDYGISLRYSTFEQLCQAGLFTVVLDAWDQMHGTPRPHEVIRDISQFSSIWKRDHGRALITCRRSFYQAQLHKNRGGSFGRDSMERASLYTLFGFSMKDARNYLHLIYQSSPAKLLNPGAWFEAAWSMNDEFFSRPLNVQLLAKYYDEFRARHDPETEHFDTHTLLEVVLEHWINTLCGATKQAEKLLKHLTWQTLQSGLNRGVRISLLAEAFYGQISLKEDTDRLRRLLEDSEFVRIQPDRADSNNDTVEFRLAAYQEFLWAYLAVQELRTKKLCGPETLINHFLLNPETRDWAARSFQQEESDALAVQLSLLAYKSAAETGYSGGNALTLLGDLNRIPWYREQLQNTRLTDRPLQGADLHGLDLSGLAFRRSNLREANLSYTTLEETDFSGADLTNARWDEYEKLKRCAFLETGNPKDVRVASGTEHGGVLTYNVGTNRQNMVNLAEDEIRDIAADKSTVYTAGIDGYVGYLDAHGNLKNAYIARRGLQSITPGASDTVYIGVEQEGLARYDWRRGTRQIISVRGQDGSEKAVSGAYDIQYWNDANSQYIAYTSEDRKELALLSLSGSNQAGELGHGKLTAEKLTFSDICFAGAYLVYAVPGRGIYETETSLFFDEWKENELLAPEKQLCSLKDNAPVELAWVKETKRILAVVKEPGQIKTLLTIPYGREKASGAKPGEVDLDWGFGSKNYIVKGGQIDGFCASADGAYAALAGERLAVFSRVGEYYALVQPPIEAKIACQRASFQGCEGLTETVRDKFRRRGAKV